MAKDPREYGFEGEMVMSQLKGIMQHAKQMHDLLEPDTDLPEWVQSKVTLAYDYLQTAADYTRTEMSEEAPVNSVGDGSGIKGLRPDSVGVKPAAMSKYKKKNAAEAPKAGRKTFSLFVQGK